MLEIFKLEVCYKDSMSLCFLFFFFQAEDGIRDRNVTGVQTCALPIFQIPAERTQAAAEVCGGSGVDEAGEGVSGIEFEQEALVSAGHGLLPAFARLRAANRLRRRLRGFRLRLRCGSGLCGCGRRSRSRVRSARSRWSR